MARAHLSDLQCYCAAPPAPVATEQHAKLLFFVGLCTSLGLGLNGRGLQVLSFAPRTQAAPPTRVSGPQRWAPQLLPWWPPVPVAAGTGPEAQKPMGSALLCLKGEAFAYCLLKSFLWSVWFGTEAQPPSPV